MPRINAGESGQDVAKRNVRQDRRAKGQATTGRVVKDTQDNQGSEGYKRRLDQAKASYKAPAPKKSAPKPKKKGDGFSIDSKKDWKGVAAKLSAAPLLPGKIKNSIGRTAVEEGPKFIKGEVESLKEGARATPYFISQLSELMKPGEAFGFTQDTDKVWDPYLNEEKFESVLDSGEPVARGALSATGFIGVPGIAKSLGAKALGRVGQAAPDMSHIARGLAGETRAGAQSLGPMNHITPRPVTHRMRDRMVGDAATPMQQSRNVYTGPAHGGPPRGWDAQAYADDFGPRPVRPSEQIQMDLEDQLPWGSGGWAG